MSTHRNSDPSTVTATYPCTTAGYWLPGIKGTHLERAPRSQTENVLYCADCVGYGTVQVTFPPLPSEEIARGGDGYDWISACVGWTVIAHWGDDGYDLGQWPYQALAVCPPHLAITRHQGYAMATYCEGDVDVTAYRTYPELEEAIGRYAHGVWRLAENGPQHVPDRFEDMAEEYKRPYGGRPLGNCRRSPGWLKRAGAPAGKSPAGALDGLATD